jgi:hypothetical protein
MQTTYYALEIMMDSGDSHSESSSESSDLESSDLKGNFSEGNDFKDLSLFDYVIRITALESTLQTSHTCVDDRILYLYVSNDNPKQQEFSLKSDGPLDDETPVKQKNIKDLNFFA